MIRIGTWNAPTLLTLAKMEEIRREKEVIISKYWRYRNIDGKVKI